MSKHQYSTEKIRKYIFDPTIDIRDRSFMLFSVLVLLALFAAVPCGLIMKEPLSATLSTLVGAVLFSIYVFISYKKRRIARARIVLSIVVIVIFLPAMFFTNGGGSGGAPIWLLLGMIYITLILDGKFKYVMLILNGLILIACWIIGYYYPSLVTEYSRGQGYFDAIAALFIVGAIVYALFSFQLSLHKKEEENKNLRRLFEQTATALVNAIDAKDKYTHGHSARVAEYSRKIAQLSGKSEEECDEIYYAALLHDVGKIGISEKIINKEGKLTEEEYGEIKKHPVLGAQILNSINEYPELVTGAKYHHERYDGRGYPDRLKGEDIPEIARIISVADAYDAMTSKRSYREPIPQQNVREEIVKGSGSQFDPKFAKLMQHLIDIDTEYDMKEKIGVQELAGKDEIDCYNFLDQISEGIVVGPAPQPRRISLKCEPLDKGNSDFFAGMVLFDSLDGRYHSSPRKVKESNYFEYARIFSNGEYECIGARKIVVKESALRETAGGFHKADTLVYDIEAVKIKDHLQITVDDSIRITTITIALPDSSRFAFIGLTGENCHIYDVSISLSEQMMPGDYIPRIAEEISFINVPAGDIPNVQVDGYRTDSTEGIPITDKMKIIFHTMSLPTARLVWHCAYVDLFYSADQKINGKDFQEYALIRLDGENWDSTGHAESKLTVNIGEDFKGWDAWKEVNKKGYDCTVSFSREGNKLTVVTQNHGILIKNVTLLPEDRPEIYAALTGDQAAITNIRIIHEDEETAE